MLGDQTNQQNQPEYVTSAPSDLEECPTCGRKFNEKAYEKHVKVCKDVFVKKRKAFDSKANRIVSNEHAQLVAKAEKVEKLQKVKKPSAKNIEDQPIKGAQKMSKWKLQSEQFRNALKGT